MYYECHITFTGTDRATDEANVKALGWLYSRIDGDPVLGAGVKSYATKILPGDHGEQLVRAELDRAATAIRGFAEVTREKIEQVIYDTRVKAHRRR